MSRSCIKIPKDTALKMLATLSAAERGAWLSILIQLLESEEQGKRTMPRRRWAAACGCNEEQFERIVQVLRAERAFDFEEAADTGLSITSTPIARDAELSRIRAMAGKKGLNRRWGRELKGPIYSKNSKTIAKTIAKPIAKPIAKLEQEEIFEEDFEAIGKEGVALNDEENADSKNSKTIAKPIAKSEKEKEERKGKENFPPHPLYKEKEKSEEKEKPPQVPQMGDGRALNGVGMLDALKLRVARLIRPNAQLPRPADEEKAWRGQKYRPTEAELCALEQFYAKAPTDDFRDLRKCQKRQVPQLVRQLQSQVEIAQEVQKQESQTVSDVVSNGAYKFKTPPPPRYMDSEAEGYAAMEAELVREALAKSERTERTQ